MEFEGFTFDAKSGSATVAAERSKKNIDVSLEDMIKKEREERREKAKQKAGQRKDSKDKKRGTDKKAKKDKDSKKQDKKAAKKSDKSSKTQRSYDIKIKEGVLRQILSEAGVDAPSDKYELRLVAVRKQ